MHSFYTFKTKYLLLVNHLELVLLFLSIYLNNPVTYCSLINFNFLLLHTAHFDKSIGFLLYVFVSRLQTIRKHCFIYSLSFYLSLEFLISSFISSNSLGTLFIKTNSLWLFFDSIKVLEIKTSTLSNLDFANGNIFLLLFVFFLVIDF